MMTRTHVDVGPLIFFLKLHLTRGVVFTSGFVAGHQPSFRFGHYLREYLDDPYVFWSPTIESQVDSTPNPSWTTS